MASPPLMRYPAWRTSESSGARIWLLGSFTSRRSACSFVSCFGSAWIMRSKPAWSRPCTWRSAPAVGTIACDAPAGVPLGAAWQPAAAAAPASARYVHTFLRVILRSLPAWRPSSPISLVGGPDAKGSLRRGTTNAPRLHGRSGVHPGSLRRRSAGKSRRFLVQQDGQS
ncbi:hypothetical protein D3C86_1355690 [compost metagenome]